MPVVIAEKYRDNMTYDVTLNKNGRNFLTPLTISGMGYGAEALDLASDFIFSDKELSAKEAKKLGREFHKRMVEYCKNMSGGDYFGSDGTGYYFGCSATAKGHNAEKYNVTIRWLQIYITAIAFNCGISFH